MNGEINVTPMVDVMLVPLIIFMVITPALAGYIARVPQAVTSLPEKDDRVTLGIDVNGGYYLDDQPQPVPTAELAGRLSTMYSTRPEDHVLYLAATSVTRITPRKRRSDERNTEPRPPFDRPRSHREAARSPHLSLPSDPPIEGAFVTDSGPRLTPIRQIRRPSLPLLACAWIFATIGCEQDPPATRNLRAGNLSIVGPAVIDVPDSVEAGTPFRILVRQFWGGCQHVVPPEIRESSGRHDVHLRMLVDWIPPETGGEAILCPDVEYTSDHSIFIRAESPGFHDVAIHGVADGALIQIERRELVR